jgi:hypothetical protein
MAHCSVVYTHISEQPAALIFTPKTLILSSRMCGVTSQKNTVLVHTAMRTLGIKYIQFGFNSHVVIVFL